MSIAMLRGGRASAAYYVERSADCHPSRYYIHDAEPVGRWSGRGSESLGLSGRIDGDRAAVFAGLLDGVLPDGTRVAQPVLRADPARPGEAKIDVRRSGLDLVVSAPKSVSVLFALADPAVSAAVVAAHQTAVAEALDYVERQAGHGLRGHQGGGQRASRIDTAGLVAGVFDHHTSRDDDPQLHTHVVVANLVHGVDGKWSAVDSRAMHRHARTAGCLYQATLRHQLTESLGVGWGPVRKGVAEIAGIPTTLRREFSTRRQAIEAELERTGSTGRAAAQRAAYVTRPTKSHTPERSLRESWADRAATLGHDVADVVASTLDRAAVPEWPAPERIAVELFGPAGLTETATSFDRRDLLQSLTEILPAGAPVTAVRLEAAADRMLDHDDAIPLLDPVPRDGDRRWSARDLLATEQHAITLSTAPTAVPVMSRVDAATVATTRHRRLSAEQRRVVVGLLTSPDLVDVVVGPAGSGKTAALHTAVTAWQSHGVPVVGCSLAAITARRLEAATHIPCSSVTRLLADLDRVDPATGRPAGLSPRSVVLVDEASMVGTRAMTRLLEHVDAAGGKLVLIGDPAQLSEIDAGGLFGALTRQPDVLTLTGNHRQMHSWERDALIALRDGDADQALAAYLTHDRIHLGLVPSRARKQLAADYLTHQATANDPYRVIALASTRRDVTRLNREIRQQLQAAGQLGPDTINVQSGDGDRRYAAGDLVIVTRNDHRTGLLNGTRATLTRADYQQIGLRTETGQDITVPTAWAADHLDHGYAMTVHKAQGLTVDTALLYGATTLCQQAGYVALSRGRDTNHLYVSHAEVATGTTGIGDPDHIDRPDTAEVLRTLARQLGIDRRHTLATQQAPQPARQRDTTPHHRPYEHDRHRDTGRGR